MDNKPKPLSSKVFPFLIDSSFCQAQLRNQCHQLLRLLCSTSVLNALVLPNYAVIISIFSDTVSWLTRTNCYHCCEKIVALSYVFFQAKTAQKESSISEISWGYVCVEYSYSTYMCTVCKILYLLVLQDSKVYGKSWRNIYYN